MQMENWCLATSLLHQDNVLEERAGFPGCPYLEKGIGELSNGQYS